MNELLALGLLFVAAFLLGSIPWGVIISRVFFHDDVRKHGSGNIGTTNAMRTMGKKAGIAVFALDFGKGLLSGALAWVFVTYLIDQASGLVALSYDTFVTCAFLGCILGHIFSPWLGFKGGKGVAVAVGCMFVTFGPLLALVECALFAFVVVATKHVSSGSLAAAIACPIIAVFKFSGDLSAILLCTCAAIVVIWAHRGNIKRLREGTERSIGHKNEVD